MKIGEVLKIFRIVRGISIAEAAKESGISYSNLVEVESGRKGVNIGEIESLAIAYGVRTSQLLRVLEESGVGYNRQVEVESGKKGRKINKIGMLAKVYGVRPSQLVEVWEKSEENHWDYTRTLYEATIEWFKTNNPAYLQEVMKKRA